VRAAPPDSEIAPQIARMHGVYQQYLRYSGVSRAGVAGKRILELGPGFTMSVPLLFVADGASYKQAVGFYRRAADRSKMMSMAGCLPNTKRFRHGRPDRGRC